MNDVQIRIGREVIEKWLRKQIEVEYLDLELSGKTLKLIFKMRILMMKMPITFSITFEKPQLSPEDPLVFKLDVNPMIRALMKEYRGEAIRMEGDKLYVYPAKFLSLLENFVIEDVVFDGDYTVIVMKPFSTE